MSSNGSMKLREIIAVADVHFEAKRLYVFYACLEITITFTGSVSHLYALSIKVSFGERKSPKHRLAP